MVRDTLQFRSADLVTNGVQTNKYLNIRIDCTIPMLITKADYLKELTITSSAGPAIVDEDFDITDKEYLDAHGEERYLLLTVAKSPLTDNRIVFYYDKLFQDIILLPNIAFLDLFKANFAYKLVGYRLGSGYNLSRRNPHQVLDVEEKYSYKLPLTNTKIANTTVLARVPGIIPEHLVRNDILEELVDNDKRLNLVRSTVQPSCLINLGKATDIFTNVSTLSLYRLSQSSIREYTIEYINNIDPEANDILLSSYF